MNRKRLFDFTLAILLLIILSPIFLIVSIIIFLDDRKSIFYLSERMKTVDTSFTLIKFRTMSSAVDNCGVSGGEKADRITGPGHFLRKSRFDEIPQLINIIKGDMSFIGPRPPLRQYVEKFPEIYGKVLIMLPGVSGLASIYYHKTEETLLSKCKNSAETDSVYSTRCVPRKARLDLIYLDNKSICYDVKLLTKTVMKVFL